ncbi:unnamed protein product [Brassica napus]|nr:unnamed protein product [Brassica napus]
MTIAFYKSGLIGKLCYSGYCFRNSKCYQNSQPLEEKIMKNISVNSITSSKEHMKKSHAMYGPPQMAYKHAMKINTWDGQELQHSKMSI